MFIFIESMRRKLVGKVALKFCDSPVSANCSVCDGFCALLSLQVPQDSLTSETLRSSLLYQQPQSLIQPSLQAEMDCDISNPLQVGVSQLNCALLLFFIVLPIHNNGGCDCCSLPPTFCLAFGVTITSQTIFLLKIMPQNCGEY